MSARPPLPPFTRDTAVEKVRLAEDAWNSRDAAKVAPMIQQALATFPRSSERGPNEAGVHCARGEAPSKLGLVRSAAWQ